MECRLAAHDVLLIIGMTHFLLVDNLQNTAGDIALYLNNELCYTLIRDAGIRAGTMLAESSLTYTF